MKLFSYGTLQRGGSNHYYLRKSKLLVEDAAIKSGYGLFIDDLPYLVKDDKGLGCFGEVYEIDEKTLATLDTLEGHPDWYRRELLTIIDLNDGKPHECWTYVYQGKKRGKYVRRF